MLNRLDILTAEDVRYIEVEVEEWGGKLRLRTMTGRDREAFMQKIPAEGGRWPAHFMEDFLVKCICDEKNKPILLPEDIEALSGKSGMILQQLFNAAAELNGLTSGSVEEIKGE